ncbi:MAG: lysophospholipid acyltransferase family protein [Ilumatobacter fluminis]|uniref:lysophospholipid acyltransferase family protein n=1 Tax=Ilumatobacter fluminis TaxID=467091 RepID=UPI0032EE118F
MTLRQRLSRRLLRLVGWRIDGEPPTPHRFVLIAAPHTSNWDFPLMMLMAFETGLSIHWLGKESLFRGLMGWFLKRLGGVPVERSEPNQLVAQMADVFAGQDDFALVVPPEGTRSRSDHWKSGFYRIADGADVPILCSYLDYSTKVGGFGPLITPTGDVSADMDLIRAFYADKHGRYPDQKSDVRLRDEAS